MVLSRAVADERLKDYGSFARRTNMPKTMRELEKALDDERSVSHGVALELVRYLVRANETNGAWGQGKIIAESFGHLLASRTPATKSASSAHAAAASVRI